MLEAGRFYYRPLVPEGQTNPVILDDFVVPDSDSFEAGRDDG